MTRNKQSEGRSVVVDDAMLRAFAKGELDEASEDRIVALLEQNPELQAKVAAISVNSIIVKLQKHSQLGATLSIPSRLANGKGVEGDLAANAASLDIAKEIEELSEFRVIKELARGGMGVVYLAENTQMGNRKEVLKVVNERLRRSDEAKARFQKEIDITAALDHPAIVKSHSVRHLENVTVFAMEFVPGSDLHEFLHNKGAIPVNIACSITTDVCSGLQYAMKKGFVNRDIKPSNIMVYKADDGQFRAKILDFGLARVEEDAFGITQDGTLLGTLDYIAPEQSLDANKADIRADIYSLGCSLYHMLAGHPPFSGSVGELILAHSQRTAPAINIIRPSVPVELAGIVGRMMAKHPADRYQTPAEIAAALLPFVSRPVEDSLSGSSENYVPAPETSGPAIEAHRDTSVVVPAATSVVSPVANSVQQLPKQPLPAVTVKKPSADISVRQKTPKLSQFHYVMIAAVFFFLLVIGGLAFSVLTITTPSGTIVIENLPKDAQVTVDGDQVKIKWNDGKALIVAKPGERKVEVRQGSAIIEGETVTVKSKGQTPFVVSVKKHAKPQLVKNSGQTSTSGTTKPSADRDETRPHPTSDTVFLHDSAHTWKLQGDTLVNTSDHTNGYYGLLFGDKDWTDYTFTFEFRCSFTPICTSAFARCPSLEEYYEFGLVWHNSQATLANRHPYKTQQRVKMAPLKANQWYRVKVVVSGGDLKGYLDDKVLIHGIDSVAKNGKVGFLCYRLRPGEITEFRNIKVISLDTETALWSGPPKLATTLTP